MAFPPTLLLAPCRGALLATARPRKWPSHTLLFRGFPVRRAPPSSRPPSTTTHTHLGFFAPLPGPRTSAAPATRPPRAPSRPSSLTAPRRVSHSKNRRRRCGPHLCPSRPRRLSSQARRHDRPPLELPPFKHPGLRLGALPRPPAPPLNVYISFPLLMAHLVSTRRRWPFPPRGCERCRDQPRDSLTDQLTPAGVARRCSA